MYTGGKTFGPKPISGAIPSTISPAEFAALVTKKQWSDIRDLLAANLITPEHLKSKGAYVIGDESDDYYETIFIEVAWLMAFEHQWQLIDILIQQRLLTSEHLLIAPPDGPDAGKNIVWLMARDKQWNLVSSCVDLINEQHLLSIGDYQRCSFGTMHKVTPLNFLFTNQQTQLIQNLFREPKFPTGSIDLSNILTGNVMHDLAHQRDSQTFYCLCELGALNNARDANPLLLSASKEQNKFILQYYDGLMSSLGTHLHDNFNLGLAIPAIQQVASRPFPNEVLQNIQSHICPVFSKTLEQRHNGEVSRFLMEIETLANRALQKYQSQWPSPFTATHAHGHVMSAHDLDPSRHNMIMTLQKVLDENGMQYMIFDSKFRLRVIVLTGTMGEREIELEPNVIMHIIQTALKASS